MQRGDPVAHGCLRPDRCGRRTCNCRKPNATSPHGRAGGRNATDRPVAGEQAMPSTVVPDMARRSVRATVCYVDTVTHREMRDDSGVILRRVEAGESIQITTNGQVAALIVPPASDPLTVLAQHGQLRPALREPSTLRDVPRRAARRPSGQILADSQGQR